MRVENDFISADIKLKTSMTYMGTSTQLEKLKKKDEQGNNIEAWDFYISKQKIKGKSDIWITLVRKNDEGENITQLDFDNISKDDFGKFIRDMIEMYNKKLG